MRVTTPPNTVITAAWTPAAGPQGGSWRNLPEEGKVGVYGPSVSPLLQKLTLAPTQWATIHIIHWRRLELDDLLYIGTYTYTTMCAVALAPHILQLMLVNDVIVWTNFSLWSIIVDCEGITVEEPRQQEQVLLCYLSLQLWKSQSSSRQLVGWGAPPPSHTQAL